MNLHDSTVTEQIAGVVREFQLQSSGRAPTAVSVVLSDDTLVVTLHEALTPAEKALARSPEGAAQVQEFHRQLFATSSQSLRREIQQITGRHVRDAAAEVEPPIGAIVHAFATGNLVQIFLLAGSIVAEDGSGPGPELHA